MTRKRARLSELILRLAVPDAESYQGLLGDLREEAHRASNLGALDGAGDLRVGSSRGATARGPGGDRRSRPSGMRRRAGYDRLVLSLAISYLADRVRRWWRRIRNGAARSPARSRGSGPLMGLGDDLRHATHLLRRRAGFSSAVIVTLALGFGAAAAVLSVAYGVWLKPLPFRDPAALVRIYEVRLEGDDGSIAGDAAIRPAALDADVARRSRLSPPLLEDLRDTRWSSLTDVAAMSVMSFEWQRDGIREQIDAVLASRGALDVLGLRPVVGGAFSSAPGVREVILGEALWRREFDADPTVVDAHSMMLDGEAHRIVGVVADGLPYPEPGGDIWVPLDFPAAQLSEGMRGARYLDVVGRLQPGATLAAAAGELDGFVRALGEDHPAHAGWGATVTPLRADLIRPYVNILRLLVVGAALFLLISCSNVAGLVAAQRVKDRAERGLRLALGASRVRVLRQEVAEMLLLCGVAGIVATLLARWALTPLRRIAPEDIPRIADIRLDLSVIAALCGFLLIAGVAIALIGHGLAGTMRPAQQQRRGAATLGTRGQSALMVGQVALTTVLLLGGAVLSAHFIDLANVDVGFRAEGVAVAPILLSEQSYPTDAQRLQFLDAVAGRLEQRGHTVAFGINPPVAGARMRFGYRAGTNEDAEQHWAQYHVVSARYFDVLGIPVLSGRAFEPNDRAGAAPVVIINQALAREHFDGDPVGREMIVVNTVREIVGVVGSVRHFGPDREPPAEMYVPLGQDPWLLGHFLVRPGDGYSPDDLREVVGAIDPGISVPPLFPYRDFVRTWFAPLRFQLTVVGLLALAATVLAIFGLYALIAYVVAGRTREIGIRVALGETSRSVFVRVVGRGMALAMGGVALGVAVALAFRGALLSLAAGIDASGVVPLVGVVGAVLAAACVATVRPARRAARIDPVVALRSE